MHSIFLKGKLDVFKKKNGDVFLFLKSRQWTLEYFYQHSQKVRGPLGTLYCMQMASHFL